LVIGEASAQPELIDGVQKDGGRSHSLLRCGAESIFDLLVQEGIFGEVEAKASLGNGALGLHDSSSPAEGNLSALRSGRLLLSPDW
jgi:hypothetical protein